MEKISKAKSLHRPDLSLKDWNACHAYISSFPEYCFSIPETLERRNHCTLSVEEFRMSYESANRPVILEGLLSSWPAQSKWSFSVDSK